MTATAKSALNLKAGIGFTGERREQTADRLRLEAAEKSFPASTRETFLPP
jgi:hypothetical protein